VEKLDYLVSVINLAKQRTEVICLSGNKDLSAFLLHIDNEKYIVEHISVVRGGVTNNYTSYLKENKELEKGV